MTIIGMFLVFIMLIVLSAFMPTIVSNVNNLTSSGVDSTTSTIAGLIPLAFVIAIIGTVFMFARPVFAGA